MQNTSISVPILKEQDIKQDIEELDLLLHFYLQQDNGLGNIVGIVIHLSSYIFQSPNINPIESVWYEIK